VNEIKTKKHTAAEGLVWLVRALDFTAQALKANIANPNEELSVSFRTAYKGTLAPHHSFLIKPVFSAAMSATPYRKDFYAKLVNDPNDIGKAQERLNGWLSALEQQVGAEQGAERSDGQKRRSRRHDSGLHDTWIIGEPFFQGTGVVFDPEDHRIGFRSY